MARAFEVYKPRTRAISGDILSELRRKKAVTGFGTLQPGEVEGVTRAVLSTEAQKASASERFGQGVREREQARQDALEASEMQGRVNLLQTGANLALLPEQLSIAKGEAAATQSLADAISGKTAAATTADTTAAATTAATTATAGIPETFTSAATGEAVSTATGDVIAGTAAAEAAPAMTFSAALGVFGFGMMGGSVGRMFHDSYLADVTGGAISGAIAGTYIFPGVGTVVGGLLGAAGASIDDTVICTELYRAGDINEHEKLASRMWRKRHVSDIEHAGYLVWATPVVRLMRRSYIFHQIVRPFGVAWVKTMANKYNKHRFDVTLPQKVFGNIALKVGLPLCRAVYRRKVRYA